MVTLLTLLTYLSALCAVVGYVWTCVAVARHSSFWLFFVLFIPGMEKLFFDAYDGETRKPRLLYTAGVFLTLFSVIALINAEKAEREERIAAGLDETLEEEAPSDSAPEQPGEAASAPHMEPAAEPQDSFPGVPAELRSLHWRVISQDARASLLQKATAPESCQVSCALKGQEAPVWSAETCLATESDPRFVSNDCERLIVLTALPAKAAVLQDVPVAHVYGRTQREHTYHVSDIVRDPGKLRAYSKAFQWLQGVSGTPGAPPHYREDGEGVDLTAIDGTARSLPFYPNQSFIELLEPGAEPRTAVSYRLSGRQLLTVDLDVTTTLDAAALRLPKEQHPPRLRFTLELKAGKAKGSGPLPVVYAVKSVKPVEPADGATLSPQQKADLKRLAKVRSQLQIAPNGLVTAVKEPEAHLSSDGVLLLPQLHAAVLQAIAIFPKEPIGPGARWRVRGAGMGAGQFTSRSCSLTAMEGGTGTLTCEQKSEARNTPLAMPNLPSGLSLLAERQTMSSTLSQSFDVTKLMAKAQVHSQIEASVLPGGKVRPTTFKSHITTVAVVEAPPDGRK